MSINPYSFKPTTVFKALDKNKDGRVTADEVSNFQKRLPVRYQQAHALLADLTYFMESYMVPVDAFSATMLSSLTLKNLNTIANSDSKNGMLNHVDFISHPTL